jgi:hypothetical protein
MSTVSCRIDRCAAKRRTTSAAAFIIWVLTETAASAQSLPNLFPIPNGSGFLETYNVDNTSIDLTGPFFQSLGTNGRSCFSCHRPAEGWSVSAAEVQTRFVLTQGVGPDLPHQRRFQLRPQR